MYMAVRVVFADDQVPSEDARQNEFARDEIIRVKGPKDPDIEAKYREDDKWFRDLIRFLEDREGFTIIRAKTKSEAESKLRQGEYDVAVVDISWFGDQNVTSGKEDAGLELLTLAAELNRGSKLRRPVIAFSQNFATDFELVAKVSDRGALPIQKYYSESGHRILGAAIKVLSDPVKGPVVERRTSEPTVKELFELVGGLPYYKLGTMLAAVAGIVSAAFSLGVKFAPLFRK
jgi:hypothetical protein